MTKRKLLIVKQPAIRNILFVAVMFIGFSSYAQFFSMYEWGRGPSFFGQGKCELGFNSGVTVGSAFPAEEDVPFIPLIGLDAGLNFSYSLTDWLKIAIPVNYNISFGINTYSDLGYSGLDDVYGHEDLGGGAGAVGSLKIPVIAAFKVLNGHIGIGFQQNLTLHQSNRLRLIDYDASSIILDFGIWTPWCFVGSAGFTDFYQRTSEGTTSYLRIGYSLNEIGFPNAKGHFFFISSETRIDFMNPVKSKKKASRRKR